jgi:hypothetical protein
MTGRSNRIPKGVDMKFQVGNRVHIIGWRNGAPGGTVTDVVIDGGENTPEACYYVSVDGHGVYTLRGTQIEIAVLDELARVIE